MDDKETVRASVDSSGQSVVNQENAAWFRELCRRMGMAEYAASAWEEWHIRPMRILVVCLGSVVLCYGIFMFTFLPGCSLDQWYPLTFVVGYGVMQVVQWGFYWRRGPRHAGTVANNAGSLLMMVCIFALMIPAIAGPLAIVPYQNRFLSTGLLSITVWLFLLGGYTGGSAPDKPPVPYNSMLAPLLKTTWTTIRVMDPVTDMILVRVLLDLSEYPCYWFGQHSPCWRYRLLAVMTGIFTGLYLFASVCIGIIGGSVDRPDLQNMMIVRSAFVLVHSIAFACEAALVAVTLLKLLSEARDPRFNGGDPAAMRQFRLNVGVTVLSFTFTAVAFVGTVVGFGTVLGHLRRAAFRVSQRINRITPQPVPALQWESPGCDREGSSIGNVVPDGVHSEASQVNCGDGPCAHGNAVLTGTALVPVPLVDEGVVSGSTYSLA